MNKGEDTRLQEFRQLKKETHGSKEYLIIGIDIAKDNHRAFFSTTTGGDIDDCGRIDVYTESHPRH
ncbi:MAG: hypothetical protein SWO11_18770 [Thermodesulfobacteriota bacterium]|nr:hypothetical protein [Thermodesulfobacteriota bacterium]